MTRPHYTETWSFVVLLTSRDWNAPDTNISVEFRIELYRYEIEIWIILLNQKKNMSLAGN